MSMKKPTSSSSTPPPAEHVIPFTVRSYEVADGGTASLSNICNYFQEAAGVHADLLQFDITQLHEKGLTWVLFKMQAEVYRFPERWEDISVKTRPSAGDGLRAFRDYELLDADGNRIAAAVSQWMVLNLKTRRPVRIPEEILELGLKNAQHIIEPDTSMLKEISPGSAEPERILKVGVHDLDMNRHVNNVKYIDWVTGYLPQELIQGFSCTAIQVQYMAESVAGDEIFHAFSADDKRGSDSVSDEPPEFSITHTLFKGNRDEKLQPIAAAVTKWSRNRPGPSR
jgi:medium-chain acyl-[acyl-carrier-protein] hydrolase